MALKTRNAIIAEAGRSVKEHENHEKHEYHERYENFVCFVTFVLYFVCFAPFAPFVLCFVLFVLLATEDGSHRGTIAAFNFEGQGDEFISSIGHIG